MTFDQAYEAYKTARAELRETQGELARKMREREKLDKEISGLVRKYTTRYGALIHAQDELKPELDKEVANAQKPEKFEQQLATETAAKRVLDQALGEPLATALDGKPAADTVIPDSDTPDPETENEPATPAEGKAD